MPGLRDMLNEGEHQQQDFKFRVDDARKIARTLVAFANTDGGRLLIGVKDNGKVVGVNAEEDFYVAEAAARVHSKPSPGLPSSPINRQNGGVQKATF
jgi:predicted HTH transcriptional regulator